MPLPGDKSQLGPTRSACGRAGGARRLLPRAPLQTEVRPPNPEQRQPRSGLPCRTSPWVTGPRGARSRPARVRLCAGAGGGAGSPREKCRFMLVQASSAPMEVLSSPTENRGSVEGGLPCRPAGDTFYKLKCHCPATPPPPGVPAPCCPLVTLPVLGVPAAT